MLRFLNFLNNGFAAVGSLFRSPILLILRLFFGISFMFAGFGKLLDISHFSDTLLTLHVPYPSLLAWLVAFTEIIGGLLLTIGLLSRIAAIPLIIVMCAAYSTVHIEALAALTTNPKLFVSEAPFNFLLTSLLVFAFGPGIFSIDWLLSRKAKQEEKKK